MRRGRKQKLSTIILLNLERTILFEGPDWTSESDLALKEVYPQKLRDYIRFQNDDPSFTHSKYQDCIRFLNQFHLHLSALYPDFSNYFSDQHDFATFVNTVKGVLIEITKNALLRNNYF